MEIQTSRTNSVAVEDYVPGVSIFFLALVDTFDGKGRNDQMNNVLHHLKKKKTKEIFYIIRTKIRGILIAKNSPWGLLASIKIIVSAHFPKSYRTNFWSSDFSNPCIKMT